MTIITKSTVTDKKSNEEDALVYSENLPAVDEDKLDLEAHAATTVLPSSRSHRLKNSVTLCVLIVALLVLIIGTLGGIHFYQQLAKERIYHSSINLPIDHPVHEGQTWETHQSQESEPIQRRPYYFHEEFHIDLDSEEFERISVTQIPRVFQIRPALFVHEFSVNRTGIIDVKAKRCFVLPLDRDRVFTPRVLFEVMVKLKAQYFTVDTKVIRQNLRIIHPRVRDLQSLGYRVARECVGYTTYHLERMTSPVFKRSIQDESINYMEFAGNLMEYNIVDFGPNA